MSEPVQSGVFPPLRLSSMDVTLYSIELRVPSPASEEIGRYAMEADIPWRRVAENALMFYRESFMTREDHARENVEWYILNFGPPKPVRRLSRRQQVAKIKTERDSCVDKATGSLKIPDGSD